MGEYEIIMAEFRNLHTFHLSNQVVMIIILCFFFLIEKWYTIILPIHDMIALKTILSIQPWLRIPISSKKVLQGINKDS